MKLLQGEDCETVGQVNREFRDLAVNDLTHGIIPSEDGKFFVCIYCGETFEEGVIYPSGPRLLTAEKAACEHVFHKHGGSFFSLLTMDKQINGLTDIQKSVMRYFYEDQRTEDICERMGISPATVRAHKYNLKKMKREAKIFLALMKLMEEEDRPTLPSLEIGAGAEMKESGGGAELDGQAAAAVQKIPQDFSGNTLHQFFSQRGFE